MNKEQVTKAREEKMKQLSEVLKRLKLLEKANNSKLGRYLAGEEIEKVAE